MPDNGGSRGSGGSGYDDYAGSEDNYWGYDNNGEYRKTYDNNVEDLDDVCAEIFEKKGWTGVQALLSEALNEGEITQSVYVSLFNKYRDM